MVYNCYWSNSSACLVGLYQNKKDMFIIGSNDLSRYEYIERIKELIRTFDYNPIFAIDLTGNNNLQAFCNNICTHIRASRLIIIDLSGSELEESENTSSKNIEFSVNVFWEYGFAAGLKKQVVVICEEEQLPLVPFDIFDKLIQPYNHDSLEEELGDIIRLKLENPIPLNQINANLTPIIDSNHELKEIFRNLLKNYLILYYSEVINESKDPNTNNTVSLLIDKLIELGDTQANHFKDQNGSINHTEIINKFYQIDVSHFKDKIVNKEIDYVQETRPLHIFAGDLGLIFFDHYEESLNQEHNYLRDLRGEFAVELSKYRYIQESYNYQRFSNALNILENDFGLIEQLGTKFEGSESETEWRIINSQRLNEFVKKNSINYILRQLF